MVPRTHRHRDCSYSSAGAWGLRWEEQPWKQTAIVPSRPPSPRESASHPGILSWGPRCLCEAVQGCAAPRPRPQTPTAVPTIPGAHSFPKALAQGLREWARQSRSATQETSFHGHRAISKWPGEGLAGVGGGCSPRCQNSIKARREGWLSSGPSALWLRAPSPPHRQGRPHPEAEGADPEGLDPGQSQAPTSRLRRDASLPRRPCGGRPHSHLGPRLSGEGRQVPPETTAICYTTAATFSWPPHNRAQHLCSHWRKRKLRASTHAFSWSPQHQRLPGVSSEH